MLWLHQEKPEPDGGPRPGPGLDAHAFQLPDETTVLVSEVACALPGCAPLETMVAFWTEGDERHHFKVFKPVAEVVLDDFPPPWMKNALIEIKGFGCDCC